MSKRFARLELLAQRLDFGKQLRTRLVFASAGHRWPLSIEDAGATDRSPPLPARV